MSGLCECVQASEQDPEDVHPLWGKKMFVQRWTYACVLERCLYLFKGVSEMFLSSQEDGDVCCVCERVYVNRFKRFCYFGVL